jgi:hypothetical protein
MIPSTSSRYAKVRAALLAFHVVAVIVLSLPGAQVARSNRWQSRLMRHDLADWAAQLERLGLSVSADELGRTAQGIAEGYVAVRSVVVAPFEAYSSVTKARQGWAMFASPQRHPYEFHVDGLTEHGWVPLYRPHDERAQFQAGYLLHNRMRKFQGRFARAMKDHYYEDFTAFVAGRALEQNPELRAVWLGLYGYASLPPERVRDGARPSGSYDNVRIFGREGP